MNIINRLRARIHSFLDRHFDELYIIHRYQREFNKPINLLNPKTFNEKILYLVLYNRVNSLSVLTDKYAVREYVRQRGLGNILNEIYGVYRKPEEINLDSLPDSFVIKATHGCSWNLLCADKKTLDWERASSNLNRWLHINYYHHKREWVYKNIPPRLIAERFLGQNITDYKFFCFNGEPLLIQIDVDRYIDHRRDFYDLDWKILPISVTYKNIPGGFARPTLLDEMLNIARTLAKGLIFARIDLYYCDGTIFFGEITLSPRAGYNLIEPSEYDLLLGQKLDISSVKMPNLNRFFLKFYAWFHRKKYS